jgi:hypothetical protein
MNSDRQTCIHLEVAINRSTTNPHDSAEDAAMRRQFAAQCAAISGVSGITDIPNETS